MNRTSRSARLGRLALVVCATLVVLVATFAVLNGADVVPADARTNPVGVALALNGVPAPARNDADSTVTLCPQAAVLALRFHNVINGRPLAHRRYTIYWADRGSRWRSRTGVTSRTGRATQRLPGRLSWVQVSANGYNHDVTVRYRACTTSVSRVSVSRLYGVHGDDRAHVRISGTVYAERRNGVRIRYPYGRVQVREDSTGRRIATLRAAATGRFTASLPVPSSTRLTVAAVAGPTGTRGRVAYGRRWVLRPTRTRVIRVPGWMRERHVRYTVSARFAPQVKRYDGGFADPSVLRVGKTYYAASTTGSDLNLPLMTSRNLTTWRPRSALSRYYEYSSWPGYNDAMAQAPAWARRSKVRENVKRISLWAPSLARIGKRRYVAAFSASTRAIKARYRHSCIGLAVSSDPDGPYRPFRRPRLCDSSTPFGAIDPDIFVDPRSHHAYLVWAAEGVPHRRRGQLAIRQLNRAGTGWAHGSRRHNLLTFTQRWEGVIMENPSMIRYHHTLYLFYSANKYGTSRYATGYAICAHVTGPCTKPRRRPLLATKGNIVGPGGADAFIDAYGHLRLAYAAWRRGHVGGNTPGRMLHVATLKRNPRTRRLTVRRMTQ